MLVVVVMMVLYEKKMTSTSSVKIRKGAGFGRKFLFRRPGVRGQEDRLEPPSAFGIQTFIPPSNRLVWYHHTIPTSTVSQSTHTAFVVIVVVEVYARHFGLFPIPPLPNLGRKDDNRSSVEKSRPCRKLSASQWYH